MAFGNVRSGSACRGWLVLLVWATAGFGPLRANELQTLGNCTWVGAEWADGDSFPVRLPDGRQQTLRLYGVDCVEWHVRDDSDARRLRAQRRYFGLAGGDASASIALARGYGEKAGVRVKDLLAHPFTVHTAFADGRGDSRYSRVYAFVRLADGRDLAEVLVSEGLARAFGVYRSTPDGRSAEAYRGHLEDLELAAAGGRKGIWASTDWSRLPDERQEQRKEDEELALATKVPAAALPAPGGVNPNTASRDELLALPGVGDVMANRIIEAREQGPFRSVEDLKRVPGVGPAMLEKLRPYLSVKQESARP